MRYLLHRICRTIVGWVECPVSYRKSLIIDIIRLLGMVLATVGASFILLFFLIYF